MGCESSTGPGDSLVPTITSVSPASLPTNASPTTLTVTGTGFERSTVLRLGGADRPTTWQSATTLVTPLKAADLEEPGALAVTAYTPPPGGGTSSVVQLTVVAAPPIVDTVQPVAFTVGQPGATISVFGRGFRPAAVVHWDGAERPTVRVSSTRLDAYVSWADLAFVGHHVVTVYHADATPDSSVARDIVVQNEAPVVDWVSPGYVTAGHTDFTLTVHGSHFVPGVVIEWNGSPRPTTFDGPSLVTVQIGASDVVSQGTDTVRAVNPDPSFGPSNLVAFPVHIPGQLVLPFEAGDLAWDPLRQRLYASIRSTDLYYPNQVLAIDPMTGDVLANVYVGSDPTRLAIANDNSTLYVGLDGAAAIRTVDLSTFTAGAQFALGIAQNRPLYADDIAVMPGHPGTVAVTLKVKGYIGGDGRGAGVNVYDNGVPRNSQVQPIGASVMTFAGPDTVFCYDGLTTSYNVGRLLVTDTGLVVDSVMPNLLVGLYTTFAYLSGYIYGTDGSIADPVQGRAVGNVPFGGTVAADSGTMRVFYMYQDTLSAIDARTFAVRGRQVVQGVPLLDQPGWFIPRLLRWGADGFAYRTFAQVVIFRSTLAAP
ncbi:MAG TPA: IPT/TIG domain-containing protein [Gemmatimonadales bacterium]|nr:IPT/TIG domain-containing protein [Gemmatimonadales bacterium]